MPFPLFSSAAPLNEAYFMLPASNIVATLFATRQPNMRTVSCFTSIPLSWVNAIGCMLERRKKSTETLRDALFRPNVKSERILSRWFRVCVCVLERVVCSSSINIVHPLCRPVRDGRNEIVNTIAAQENVECHKLLVTRSFSSRWRIDRLFF